MASVTKNLRDQHEGLLQGINEGKSSVPGRNSGGGESARFLEESALKYAKRSYHSPGGLSSDCGVPGRTVTSLSTGSTSHFCSSAAAISCARSFG
jgi:hypothetical protein